MISIFDDVTKPLESIFNAVHKHTELCRRCLYVTAFMLMGTAGTYSVEAAPALPTSVQQAALDRAIQENPKNSDAWLARAQFRMKIFEEQLALDDCNKAIAIAPDNWSAYALRGRCYQTTSRADLALKDWAVCIKGDNDEAASEAMSFAYKELIGQGKYDEARKLLTIFIDKHKTGPWITNAYTRRATCFTRIGNTILALKDLEEVDRLSKGRLGFAPCRDHARIYKQLKNYEKAIYWYTRAIVPLRKEHNFRHSLKDLSALYRERGECYQLTGHPALAKRDLESAANDEKEVYGNAMFRMK